MRARVVLAAAGGDGARRLLGHRQHESNVTTSGHTLTVYLAAPAGGGQAAGDVLAAERLAFQARSHEVSAFALRLRTLTAAQAVGGRPHRDPGHERDRLPGGDRARDLAATRMGITNAQQLLQVSPTDTAQGLTNAHTPGLSDVPNKYLESVKTYGRTFARVVPTTGAEAQADAARAHQARDPLAVRRLRRQ